MQVVPGQANAADVESPRVIENVGAFAAATQSAGDGVSWEELCASLGIRGCNSGSCSSALKYLLSLPCPRVGEKQRGSVSAIMLAILIPNLVLRRACSKKQ